MPLASLLWLHAFGPGGLLITQQWNVGDDKRGYPCAVGRTGYPRELVVWCCAVRFPWSSSLCRACQRSMVVSFVWSHLANCLDLLPQCRSSYTNAMCHKSLNIQPIFIKFSVCFLILYIINIKSKMAHDACTPTIIQKKMYNDRAIHSDICSIHKITRRDIFTTLGCSKKKLGQKWKKNTIFLHRHIFCKKCILSSYIILQCPNKLFACYFMYGQLWE